VKSNGSSPTQRIGSLIFALINNSYLIESRIGSGIEQKNSPSPFLPLMSGLTALTPEMDRNLTAMGLPRLQYSFSYDESADVTGGNDIT
jgi:hypothetical protein